MNMSPLAKNLRRTIVVIGMISLIACGGGTHGTGGDRLSGEVLDSFDRPISDVSVIVKSSGESDVTDTEGRFAITTNLPNEDFEVILQSERASAHVSIPVETENPSSIAVTIRFDEEASEAELFEVNEDEESNPQGIKRTS